MEPPQPPPPTPVPRLTLTVHNSPAEEYDHGGGINTVDPERLTLLVSDWVRARTNYETRQVVADWENSNPAVARVRIGLAPGEVPLGDSDDITIEAVGVGEATLTAHYEGAVTSVDILVPRLPLNVDRSLTDRPDEVHGPQIHAVYAVASDGEDMNLDRQGRIGWSLRATVDWLTDKLGRRLRVDMYGGIVDVTFLRLRETQAEMNNRNVIALANAIRQKSWYSSEKTYAVYYQGPTDRPGGQATSWQGSFASVATDSRGLKRPTYRVTIEPGWLGALENSMAHELFHTMGAVDAMCATNPAPDGSHTNDHRNDLMNAPRRRGRMLSQIDIGRDDYYEHDIPDCPDTSDSPLWMDPHDAIPAEMRPRVRIHPSAHQPIICLDH